MSAKRPFIPENGIFSIGGLLSHYEEPVTLSQVPPTFSCAGQKLNWKKPRLSKPPTLLPASNYERLSTAVTTSSTNHDHMSRNDSSFSRSQSSRARVDEEPCALKIDMLLMQILENLPPSDLKTCRLVSHGWNDIATKLLLKKKSLQVSSYFQRNEHHKEYSIRVRHGLAKWKDYDLDDLTNLVSNSLNFPCNSFRFFDGNLITPALQRFFDKHGSIVKNLLLDIYFCRGDPIRQVLCDYPRIEALAKLLTDQVKNLDTLTLINFPDIGYLENSSLFPSGSAVIPSLKYLEMEDDEFLPFAVYTDLIEACPNLQHVTLESLRHIQYLVDTARVGLIYGLNLRSSSQYLKVYEHLLRYPDFQLQKIVMRLGNIHEQDEPTTTLLASVIVRLLNKCSRSLSAIQWQPLGSLGGFAGVCPMPCVSHLGIADVPGAVTKIFPEEMNLNKTFPNLRSLSIELTSLPTPMEEDDEVLDDVPQYFNEPSFSDYFPAYQLTSVVCLSLSSVETLPLSWLPQIASMLPNCRCGKFSGITSPNYLRCLWKFSSLQTLIVHFDMSNGENLEPNALDSAFTGLDPTDCHNLFVLPIECSSVFTSTKPNTSIAELKNLKSLRIILEDKQPYHAPSPIPVVLTKVAKQFCANYLPNLNSQLEFVAEALENLERLKLATSNWNL